MYIVVTRLRGGTPFKPGNNPWMYDANSADWAKSATTCGRFHDEDDDSQVLSSLCDG
jgi:hypothetical protein